MSSILPIAGLGEISRLIGIMTGGEATLLSICGGWGGGWGGVAVIGALFIAYIAVTFVSKRDKMRADRIDMDYKKAETERKESIITDIVNIDNSLFFQ